jgi:hypothetical protein
VVVVTQRIRDLLARRAVDTFVGRGDELAILHDLLVDGGPSVVFLHGIGGIGKTSLLEVFATRARTEGATVLRLDCRTIEPTERGLLGELALATGGELATVEEAADRLGSLGGPVVVVLDTYEVFRYMDTWLRQVFVPSLGENVRVVFAGREPPVSAWLMAWGSEGLFRSVPLGPLGDREAAEILGRVGAREDDLARINRFTRGHPLALRLAAAAAAERPDLRIEDVAAQRVVAELTRIYLADVPDPLTREVLEAASVVRRTTHSLLRAMLPDLTIEDAFERLRDLPFVESGRDGLIIHDLVHEAIDAALRAADPSRRRAYRRSAWRQLTNEVKAVSRTELWRYTADLLYMIENPLIREAFFPSGAHVFSIEPARTEDGPAIEEITHRHEGPQAASYLTRWWRQAPQVFRVVRDRDGLVAGYYGLFEPSTVPVAYVRDDPVVGRWWRHLQRTPIAKGEKVLFSLRWLSRELGEAPSPVQAVSWLDIKVMYMELRPHLRRIYMVVRDMEIYGPVAKELGFQLVPDGTLDLDGVPYYSVVLDFGPSSIDGWLIKLMGAELGEEGDELLDREAQELVVGGKRVKLTSLEFKTMDYLCQREGKVVARASLLEDVWGYAYDGGSNVVDVVVRSLRKKLGPRASAIETVTGTGYRLRRG